MKLKTKNEKNVTATREKNKGWLWRAFACARLTARLLTEMSKVGSENSLDDSLRWVKGQGP